MTQWPTVTREGTGNKGNPPQDCEPEPTRDNPFPAVLPPTPPEPSGLHKAKEKQNRKRGTNGKKTKKPPTAPPNKGNKESRFQMAPTTQLPTTRSSGYHRANRKKSQSWIGLFPTARLQTHKRDRLNPPDNSRTPPTDRNVPLQDPRQPKREEVSRERNNHCKD